jgi:hypothetical protein
MKTCPIIALAVVACTLVHAPAHGQGYPDHPIRLIVPYPSSLNLKDLTKALADEVPLWKGVVAEAGVHLD